MRTQKLSFILSTIPITTFTTVTGSAEHQAADFLFLLFGPAEKDQAHLAPAVMDFTLFQRNLHMKMKGRPCPTVMENKLS